MMTKNRKVHFLLIIAIVISLIIVFFNVRMNFFERNLFSTSSKSPFEFAYVFAEALRNNDPDVYELTSVSNYERIDRWMETHEVQNCDRVTSEPFTGSSRTSISDSQIYHTTIFSCQIKDVGSYKFSIKDIEIEIVDDTYFVKDWVDPTEELRK